MSRNKLKGFGNGAGRLTYKVAKYLPKEIRRREAKFPAPSNGLPEGEKEKFHFGFRPVRRLPDDK